jgi:uncharacterized protein YodC (DUF2158 family)
MEEGFVVGDVVQLKSGGPLMTVKIVAAGSAGLVVTCVYFSGDKKIEDVFVAGVLDKNN